MTATFTLNPGHYVIGDACVTSEEYYENVLLDEFIELGHGESVQAGESVILATGSDGLYSVTHKDTGENLKDIPVDAANVAIVPASEVPGPGHSGLDVVFTEPFDVVCYDDAMVIGGQFRVRI